MSLPAGTVLVTFKSHTMSVPPYRIENQCSDVHIYLVQACLAGERPGRWIWLPPRVSGSSLAYAWDEPNEEHRLRVKVCASHTPMASATWCSLSSCSPPLEGCACALLTALAMMSSLDVTGSSLALISLLHPCLCPGNDLQRF